MTLGPDDALKRLNAMTAEQASAELMRCCGSSRWIQAMVDRRPFRSADQLLGAARSAWQGLAREDWIEAFGHHPKIGDLKALKAKFRETSAWVSAEQSGAASADDEVLNALAEGNRDYERKFGFIFIVCATGKTAPEMLCLLQSRLNNSLATELRIAANEQAKITRLRLEKLLRSC